MAETPTYSHLDIQRYLQHKMSPQEMHAFEKALMDDPFLADAMEGFAASDTTLAAEHVTEIERQLTVKKEETKVVPLSAKTTSWWKVAAVVLVIITGGILSYSLLSKNEADKNIAQQITADSSREEALTQDSVGPADKTLVNAEKTVQNEFSLSQQQAPVANKTYKNPTISLQKDEARQADSAEIKLAGKAAGIEVAAQNREDEPLIASAPKPTASKDEQILLSKRMLSPTADTFHAFIGKVNDEKGQPLAYATIAGNNHTQTVTDENGNFILKAPDSVLQVTVNSIGYVADTVVLTANALANNIKLSKNSQDLSEVVVTGYSSKKKSVVKKNAIVKTAEPVGGWKNFEQYLHKQTDSLRANNDNDYNEEDVVLEFFIDIDGRPTKIKVADQAENANAQKAIRILSNGPKWNKKQDKKVKVTIAF